MLDEGLTTWATWDLLGRMYGRDASAFDLAGLQVDAFELFRAGALRRGKDLPPPGQPAHAFDAGEYGPSVYGRSALVWETVARTYGRERFHRALGRYARAYRYRHPAPGELFGALETEYGPGFTERVLEPALMRGAHASVALEALRQHRGEQGWRSRIEGARKGGLALPTRVAVHPRNREPYFVRWRPADRGFDYRARDDALRAAEVDPGGRLLLDPSVLDNRVRSGSAPRSSHGLFAQLLLFAQTWLLGIVGP
jgi:hypothetical protein